MCSTRAVHISHIHNFPSELKLIVLMNPSHRVSLVPFVYSSFIIGFHLMANELGVLFSCMHHINANDITVITDWHQCHNAYCMRYEVPPIQDIVSLVAFIQSNYTQINIKYFLTFA